MIQQADIDGLLNDTATLWALSDRDERGMPVFAAPVAIPVRWEDTSELFLSKDGEQLVSRAVVYVDRAIPTDSRLYHGTSTAKNPLILADAYPVKQSRATPALRSSVVQREVLL